MRALHDCRILRTFCKQNVPKCTQNATIVPSTHNFYNAHFYEIKMSVIKIGFSRESFVFTEQKLRLLFLEIFIRCTFYIIKCSRSKCLKASKMYKKEIHGGFATIILWTIVRPTRLTFWNILFTKCMQNVMQKYIFAHKNTKY